MRLGILTGGGDVAPLNAVISSVINRCNRHSIELIGYLRGWEGVLEDNWIKLNDFKIDPDIGGTFLKSSRVNLKKTENGPETVIHNLEKQSIDGLIVVGGEDTLSNALLIKNFPKVLLSKTIDNDVGLYNDGSFLNTFTLGYPTAAEKIASFVSLEEGIRTTAWSHERIMVVESMGMHAGWLALASSSGNPDFIIIPEFPLDFEKFREKVISKYKEKNHVIIVVSEGAKWKNGHYISADELEKDSFGHPRFIGTAQVLTKHLKESLKKDFDTRNVNFINPSYLYRSGRPNTVDKMMAIRMGVTAVDHLNNSIETIFIYSDLTGDSCFETCKYNFNNLTDIEEFHRFVDDTLYDPVLMNITPRGEIYFNSFVPHFKKSIFAET